MGATVFGAAAFGSAAFTGAGTGFAATAGFAATGFDATAGFGAAGLDATAFAGAAFTALAAAFTGATFAGAALAAAAFVAGLLAKGFAADDLVATLAVAFAAADLATVLPVNVLAVLEEVFAIMLFAVFEPALAGVRDVLTSAALALAACARDTLADVFEAPRLAAAALLDVRVPDVRVLNALPAPLLPALLERDFLFDTTYAWNRHAPVLGLFPGNPACPALRAAGN